MGEDEEIFTVHENLICVSPYFRHMLQPGRKTIEGDCSICHEVLGPKKKEPTYCSESCGNNFHMACIEDWHEYAASDRALKCPMCRQNWAHADTWGGNYDLPEINADAFDIYTEWLYKSSISKGFDPNALMRAYLFGEYNVCDPDFCHDVLCAIIATFVQMKTSVHVPFITRVYDSTNIGSPLRALMVGLYMQLPRDILVLAMKRHRTIFDSDFLADVVMALALKGTDPPVGWKYAALKDKLVTCSWTI